METKKTENKNMGFGLILVGFLFFAIPTVNLVDIMPDFIGYILIFAGLKKTKFLTSYLYKAAHYSMVMAIVNLTKPVLLALCLVGDTTSKASNLTTATLAYLVIEMIFGLIMMKNLFDGFSDLGFQYDDSSKSSVKLIGRFLCKREALSGEHSFKNPQSAEHKRLIRNGKLHSVKYVRFPRRKAVFKGVDGLYVFTMIFFAIRCILTLIPELTTLAYTEGANGMMEMTGSSETRIALMALCLILGLILGFAWYFSASGYLKGVKKDGIFNDSLKKAFEKKVESNADVQRYIHYRGFEKLIFAALIFGGDFFLDGFDFIPDIVAAVLLLIAALIIKNYIPKILRFIFAVYTAVCGVLIYLQIENAGKYYAYSATEEPLTSKLFKVLFPVSKAFFIVLLFIIFASQYSYMKKNFKRAPMYAKGKLIFGMVTLSISQIISAIGYFTDVVSDDLLHFPMKVGRAVFDVNVYVSFGAMVIYYISIIGFSGGIAAISRKLSGKE